MNSASPWISSSITAAVFCVTALLKVFEIIEFNILETGTTGAKGSLNLGCLVAEIVPRVLPWKLILAVIISTTVFTFVVEITSRRV